MDEKERITNPSMGSNELGSETEEDVPTGVSSGTDTQTFLAAAGGKKHKKQNISGNKNVNKNNGAEDNEYPEVTDTDE